MADYAPILTRAIASLSENTPDARSEIYVKARIAIDRQLRSMDPTPSEKAIKGQLVQLEDAILVVENSQPKPEPEFDLQSALDQISENNEADAAVLEDEPDENKDEIVESQPTTAEGSPELEPEPEPVVAAVEVPDTPYGFIDDISLLDGVGPKTTEALNSVGVVSLIQIAHASEEELAELTAHIGFPEAHKKQEWKTQSIAMLSGDMPRSKTDAERLKKLKQVQPASVGGWLTVPADFIDEPILIDGIGEKTASALKANGVLSISQIAGMSNVDLAEVTSELNISGYEVKQEWKAQASAMLSGKPPRSKADQDRLKKLKANKKPVEEVVSELRPPDGFIENVILIDGIGEKTALALRNSGVSKISQIATMPEGDLAKVVSRIGIPGFEKTQEWQQQSIDMVKGALPRSVSDQDKLKSLIEERVAAKLRFEQQVAEAEKSKVDLVAENEELEIADVAGAAEVQETIVLEQVEPETVDLDTIVSDDVVEEPQVDAISIDEEPFEVVLDEVEAVFVDETSNEVSVDREADDIASVEAAIADLSSENQAIEKPFVEETLIGEPVIEDVLDDTPSIEQLFETELGEKKAPNLETPNAVNGDDDVADFIKTLDSETTSESVTEISTEIPSDNVEAPVGAVLEEEFTLDDILSEMGDDEKSPKVNAEINGDTNIEAIIDANIADVTGEAPVIGSPDASLDMPFDPELETPEFISDLGAVESKSANNASVTKSESGKNSFSFVRAFGCFGMLALLGGAAYAGWENRELVQSYSQQALSSVRSLVGIEEPMNLKIKSMDNPEMEEVVESTEAPEVKTPELAIVEQKIKVELPKDNSDLLTSEMNSAEKNSQRLGADGQTQNETSAQTKIPEGIASVVIEPSASEPIAGEVAAVESNITRPEIVQPVQKTVELNELVETAQIKDVQLLPITGEKAFLYEEASSASGANREEARVSWRLDKASPGEGLPKEAVIKGTLEILAKGLSLNLSISRNVDAGLPASHIVELIFTNTEAFSGRGIDSVPRLVMKSSEEARGEGLVGVPAKIDNGYFFVALNNLPQAVETNEKLLLGSDWIDIPMGYLSGRRAFVVMQKGETGTKVFQDAFDDWRNR